jgi:hypothetical protein
MRTEKPTDIQQDLAALADGSLPAERAKQVEQRILASPEHTHQLAEQRRVIELLRSSEVTAPDSLHRTIRGRLANSRHGRSRIARRWTLAAAAGLAIVAVLAITLALNTDSPEAPTVLQASRLALRPATEPSPAENTHNRRLLTSSVDGIAYPYWGKRFGFKTDGARKDRLGGRAVMTVFYSNAKSQRIGYSIVAGSALDIPAGKTWKWSGVSFQVVSATDTTIVTWRRGGHTCILPSQGVASQTLLHLASWQRS